MKLHYEVTLQSYIVMFWDYVLCTAYAFMCAMLSRYIFTLCFQATSSRYVVVSCYVILLCNVNTLRCVQNHNVNITMATTLITCVKLVLCNGNIRVIYV